MLLFQQTKSLSPKQDVTDDLQQGFGHASGLRDFLGIPTTRRCPSAPESTGWALAVFTEWLETETKQPEAKRKAVEADDRMAHLDEPLPLEVP